MKQQAFNPYLPSYEYIPDAEPRVFGSRVYIFGSHDTFNSNTFCKGDYVSWSCPVDDLSDWRYEGVIYKRTQDPFNKLGKKFMYAPDVVQGVDGKYYLYYFVGYTSRIGVAACDTPVGQYQFVDYVHYEDGTPLGRKSGDVFQFDPGVYVEGDRVYLYTGFCPIMYPLVWGKNPSKNGAVCTALLSDMATISSPPKYIGTECKKSGRATPYEGHEFFEAASLRKIRDKYYFIYSSFLGHELCYAISDRPDGEFKFGGTIISIGDIGLRGIKGVKDADNYCGNTHGSILELGDKLYIFYHRQTNRHCFSRQACAEEITINADGSIDQVEVTSCGLNGKPLLGKGTYDARIASTLKSAKGGKFYMPYKCSARPYFTQSGGDRDYNPDQYIANIDSGTVIGFKYFDFIDTSKITVTVKGNARGKLKVSTSDRGEIVGTIDITPASCYSEYSTKATLNNRRSALYFKFEGTGKLSFKSFTLI